MTLRHGIVGLAALFVGCGRTPVLPAFDDSGSTTLVAQCGDGTVEGAEVCDDGVNDGSYGSCAPDCASFGPRCGDGTVDAGSPEECDDGNALAGDGCDPDCIRSGRTLWTDVRPAKDAVTLSDLALVPDGRVAVVGTRRPPKGSAEGFVQLLDAAGVPEWDRSIQAVAPSSASLGGVVVSSNDRLAVGGEMGFSPWVGLLGLMPGGPVTGLTLDYDTVNCDGVYYSFRTIGPVTDDGFLVQSGSEGGSWIALVGADGVCRTSRFFVNLDDVIVLPDNQTMVALSLGFNKSVTTGTFVVELDLQLQEQIRRELTPVGFDNAMVRMPDGQFMVVTREGGGLVFTRLDAAYRESAPVTYTEAGVTFREFDLAVDGDGNLVVAGESEVSGGEKPVISRFVRKFDAQARLLWTREEPVTAPAQGWTDVEVDAQGDIYVTGSSDKAGSYTRKLSR